MGNQCCLAVGEGTVKEPHRPSLQFLRLQGAQLEAPEEPVKHDHDLVYAQPQLKDLSSRMNIPQAISKRSSEASLLRLNNDLTNMINTFEKAHGTIGNELTRSKMINSTKKIRELNEQGNDILKKKRISEVVAPNEDASLKGIARIMAVSVVEQEELENTPEGGDIKPIDPQQSRCDSIQESYSSSSASHRDYYNSSGDQAEASKYLLDADLVDEEVEKLKQDMYLRSATIQGNSIPLWDIFDTEPFVLNIDNLSQDDPVMFAALGSIAFYHLMFKITLPAYHRNPDMTIQVKLWINGTKRSLMLGDECPLKLPAEQIFIRAIHQIYGNSLVERSPCYEVYHLSGWCPECLMMEEITNKDNLWQRLAENFLEGNILITFGRKSEEKEIFFALKNVKREEGILELLCPNGPPVASMSSNSNNLYEVEWSKLNSQIDCIYINWNPSIYSFNKKFDSSWTVKPSMPFQNQQICVGSNPQYLIKIPKHEEDFEIRIFADRHIKSFQSGQRLVLKLFEYDGVRVLDPRSSIRSFDSAERELLSDVFIFQKSEEVDYFVLVVMKGEEEPEAEEELTFSILFLSFIDVEVSQLPQREALLSKVIESPLRVQNVGMGVNSPNFTRNLHYTLQVPLGSDIQMFAEATGSMDFMLMLLEDPQKNEDLLRVNFETVLGEDNSSDLFHRYGFLERQARVETYILVLACFSAEGPQQVKLTANVVSKLQRRNRELEECYPPILLEELQSRPNIIRTHPIRWIKENTGQRKRLKNTTTPIYHPISVFAEFLKNPCVQLKLPRGRYQFNIASDDYRKEFLSITAYEREQKMLEPPPLSLAILRLSDNEKGYKIILDDAFYVPIGYGYWSEELPLEEGRYTIVCPRLNHEVGRGTLSVRQL